MTRFAVLGLISVVVATAPAAPVPKQKQVSTSFFPTAVGTKWVYSDGSRDFTRFIGEANKKGDDILLVINEVLPKGQIVVAEELTVSPKGVFVGESAGLKFDPPSCQLKYPSSPGDAWEMKSLCAGRKSEGTMKLCKLEEIKVPAGKFDAYRVEYKGTYNGRAQERTIWYAAGIGPIKLVYPAEPAELSVCHELKSFTKGKE